MIGEGRADIGSRLVYIVKNEENMYIEIVKS